MKLIANKRIKKMGIIETDIKSNKSYSKYTRIHLGSIIDDFDNRQEIILDIHPFDDNVYVVTSNFVYDDSNQISKSELTSKKLLEYYNEYTDDREFTSELEYLLHDLKSEALVQQQLIKDLNISPEEISKLKRYTEVQKFEDNHKNIEKNLKIIKIYKDKIVKELDRDTTIISNSESKNLISLLEKNFKVRIEYIKINIENEISLRLFGWDADKIKNKEYAKIMTLYLDGLLRDDKIYNIKTPDNKIMLNDIKSIEMLFRDLLNETYRLKFTDTLSYIQSKYNIED